MMNRSGATVSSLTDVVVTMLEDINIDMEADGEEPMPQWVIDTARVMAGEADVALATMRRYVHQLPKRPSVVDAADAVVTSILADARREPTKEKAHEHG